jgi:hypothetical protein
LTLGDGLLHITPVFVVARALLQWDLIQTPD